MPFSKYSGKKGTKPANIDCTPQLANPRPKAIARSLAWPGAPPRAPRERSTETIEPRGIRYQNAFPIGLLRRPVEQEIEQRRLAQTQLRLANEVLRLAADTRKAYFSAVAAQEAVNYLAQAQAAGLKTSVDVVSEDSDRFGRIVTPALQYVDYCILNELEAGRTTGFKIRLPDGSLDPVALRHAAGALLQKGVRELVVIHFPEGAFARTRKGEDVWQMSLRLPEHYIIGTAGAGDAFCAGVLWGLHEGWDLQRCLLTGVCLAAASLSDATCTAGVKSLQHALGLARRFGFRPPLEPQE